MGEKAEKSQIMILWLLLTGVIVTGCEHATKSSLDDDIYGLTWEWEFDDSGRVVEVVGPGNITTQIAYKNSVEKDVEVQTTIVDFYDEKRVFVHDQRNRLLSAKDAGGAIAFQYNTDGFLEQVQTTDAPTLRYEYDVQNRLVKTYIGDTKIKYRYDYLGRLASIITPAGDVEFSYHRATNTTIRRLPNGVRTVRQFDIEGKLSRLLHIDPKNHLIAGYYYDYRPDGLIGTITEKSQRYRERVTRYEYDLMHRLIAVEQDGKSGLHAYKYDVLGNLVKSREGDGETLSFTNTPAGALLTDSRGDFTIDERGHIRELPGQSPSIDYDFNGAGELTGARGSDIQYRYNALGMLTSRSIRGRETIYLASPFIDTWQPLWQRDFDGKESVIVWDGGVPFMELQGGSVHYRLEDHLGSTRVEASTNGKITAWHNYSPYGVPDTQSITEDLLPGFAGLFWDSAAQVYLAKARAYTPHTGRFLQPDPKLRIPDASKHNHSLYAYSVGDPVNFIDRDGAEALSVMLTDGNDYAASGLSLHFSPAARPMDRPQERDYSGDAKRWFVETLQSFELEELRLNFDGKLFSELPRKNRAKVRNRVLERFGADYADFPGHFINTGPSLRNYANYDEHVANRSILTQDGWSSLDWTATNIQTGWFIPLKPTPRLHVGKFVSNIIGGIRGNKAWPKKGTWYPRYAKNAALLEKRIRNIDISYASAVFVPEGIMEPSIHASPMSLTPTVYGTFKRSIASGSASTRQIQSQADIYSNFMKSAIDRAIPIIEMKHQTYEKTGIDYQYAGPGGKVSPPEMQALRDFQTSTPSPVGGVYLGGAGAALDGLGQLKGVAVDEATGKLVLFGSEEQKIKLPPLRLDDIVTVFRAVYDYGESPSVTIDPDEDNPNGPTMDVKHGPGTKGTYVGWILFECDRIMKTYQLGEDNITNKPIISKISNYRDVLDAVYFGGDDKVAEQEGLLSSLLGIFNTPGENWERFWIMPANVKRFDLTGQDLSLFDISLKVKTQKMRWKWGNLVDDKKGESSFGAKAFKNWFSNRYNEIADEVLLEPPPETGIKNPVAIFRELRRIALMVAIAEYLRESGQAMPSWMRDYKVKYFPVSSTTPSLTKERTKNDGSVIRTSRIYGGVILAPADKDVYVYDSTREPVVELVPEEHVTFFNIAKQEAAVLKAKIPKLVHMQKPVGTVQHFRTEDANDLSAVILPGVETRALAPNRQEVTDIAVPIGLGRSISLTRHYNSFFDPIGEFGAGWSMNLPKLLMPRVPVKRDGEQPQYRVVPHLISPLGTIDIRFDSIGFVDPYGVQMFVTEGHPEVAGVGSGYSKIIKTQTHQVFFRNGTIWHFDDESRLVLEQVGGTATHYARNSAGLVSEVVGYIGLIAVAKINLAYNQQGWLIEAKAAQEKYLSKQLPAEVTELNFKYTDDGRLRSVVNLGKGKRQIQSVEWSYLYESNHLSQIVDVNGAEALFEYDERGQMLSDKRGAQVARYTVEATQDGAIFTSSVVEEGNESLEKWTYDTSMRPVEAEVGGGTTIRWRYGQGNEVSETLYREDIPIFTRSTSPDGRNDTSTWADGKKYEIRRDPFGYPTALSVDGIQAVNFKWGADGIFEGLRTSNTEMLKLWHEDGWSNGVLIEAPKTSGETSKWLAYEWDFMERPTKITDSSGYNYIMEYDDEGRINSIGQLMENGKLVSIDIDYNSDGLITDIETPWGTEERKYASDGILESILVSKEGRDSETEFDDHGRMTRLSAYDGSTVVWHYESDAAGARLKAIELANDEKINYSWSNADGAQLADARMGTVIVRTQSDNEGRVTAMTWGRKED